MGFTNNKTDKILEFKNQGIKAAAGTVKIPGRILIYPRLLSFEVEREFD